MRRKKSNHPIRATGLSFLAETAIYALFVFIYFYLVLRGSGSWLKPLFDRHRVIYAATAFGIIMIQGFILEVLTDVLYRVFRRTLK